MDTTFDGTLQPPDAHLTGPMMYDAKHVHFAAKEQT